MQGVGALRTGLFLLGARAQHGVPLTFGGQAKEGQAGSSREWGGDGEWRLGLEGPWTCDFILVTHVI